MTIQRDVPYAWSGPPGYEAPTPLSLLDLIKAGNMTEEVGAILWALLHRRPSMIVAAVPQRAGKTATLTALLDLLPASFARIYLRGVEERFDFMGKNDPATTILLVNELSDHLPFYLWGDEAKQALELLKDGYALAATMHADSPEQVMGELAGLGLGPEVLGLVTAVVNMEVFWDQRTRTGEPLRRVSGITLVQTEGKGLRFSPVMQWDAQTDRFTVPIRAVRALASRLSLDATTLAAERRERAAFLVKLRGSGGLLDRARFREAAMSYSGPVA